MRQGTVIITSLTLVIVPGCGGKRASDDASGISRGEVVFPIDQQNGSGLSGTATLIADGDETKVVIELQSRSATAGSLPRPAHIYPGSCENLAPKPVYGLAAVHGGSSTTTIDAKLPELYKGAFAVNVHESADRMNRYVACGDFGEENAVSLPGYSHD